MVVHAFRHKASFSRGITALAAIMVGAVLAMAGLLSSAQPAAAQQGFGNFFGYQTSKPRKRRAVRRRQAEPETETAKKKEDSKESKPTDPVYVIVSLGDQHMSVYDANGRIAQSSVSTGKAGHRTPSGVFSVIGKRRHHYSNLYGGAPMPWMQRITWSGVAMHAGVVPGYAASHGCIRVPYSFAPRLWQMTKMGARVVVSPRDVTPVDITHKFLPAPAMHSAPGAVQQAGASTDAHIELASLGSDVTAAMTTAATNSDATTDSASKLLNPMDYAEALKTHAKAQKQAADKAAKERLAAAQAIGAEARQAEQDVEKGLASLKKAEARLADAEDDLKAAEDKRSKAEAELAAATAKAAELSAQAVPLPVPSGATDKEIAKLEKVTEDIEKAAEKAKKAAADAAQDLATAQKRAEAAATAKTAALSELSKARGAIDEARQRQTVKSPAAFAAVQSWKEAVAISKAAAKDLDEAERRLEPVSVFISKKEGRVFIRQDWKEVYEAPVTIRDPERPLGTHVYIAVASEPDGSAMRWSAITMPSSGEKAKKKKSAKGKSKDETAQSAAPAETAAGALDRIELPEGARERIAELLWTGGSLIVSDQPRSYEMGEYTDFIVLTR